MTDVPLLPATGKNVLKLFPEVDAASGRIREHIDSVIEAARDLNAHLVVDRDLYNPEGPYQFIIVRGDTRFGPLTVTRAELESGATVDRLKEWIESAKAVQ